MYARRSGFPLRSISAAITIFLGLAALCCSKPPSGASLGAEGDAAPAPATGTPMPAIRIVGRADSRDPAGPRVALPGTRIIARFQGTAANVRLADTAAARGPSRFEVIVDGVALSSALAVTTATTDYPLVRGLAPGIHTLELYRLTEAQVGTTQILGFDFEGGTLLPPPPASPRRLEFVGDSTSNGYGVEGTAPCEFSGATQNERKAYPALVAIALGAEHVNFGYSGKGVLQNYTRSDDDVFGVLYPRALPDDPTSAWDFPAASMPEAVFVNLGGNDWDQPSPDTFDPPAVDAFATKYAELLAAIRARYPTAHVIGALGPSQTDAHPDGYQAFTKGKAAVQAAIAKRTEAGDTRVYYFEPTRLTEEYRTGCNAHPNAAFHEVLAVEIAAAIKEKTGW
jgi:lysophospholipase L1-like esterase